MSGSCDLMSTIETGSPNRRHLPSSSERPRSDVVIYDGNCRFCTERVQWLAKWDLRGRLAFLSLHDEQVAVRFPDLSHEQLMSQMYVIDANGGRHGGAAAIRYLSRRLPMFWPIALLLHIPFTLPVWQWLYRQVASHRYWLSRATSCDDGTCHLHQR